MQHELVRLSPVSLETFHAHVLQEKILDLQMEIITLRDLVQQLDPNHEYVFSQEYRAFVKTKKTRPDVKQTGSELRGAVLTQGFGG